MDKINYRMIIVTIFVILLTALAIVQTYALFETNATGTHEFDIGQWVILLNGNDVTETRTVTLDDFIYTNGVHTQDGYFAPGSSASFDLEIDASSSDVSVEYTLDIDDSQLEDYPNIYFTVTNLSNNETITSNTCDGVIALTDQDRTLILRINLVWDNQVAYDESDSSLIDGNLAFTITANFKQYTGE